MSSIIQSKQDQERKAALSEDRRKREKRRLRELGAPNGNTAATYPEDEEDQPEAKHFPIRTQSSKGARSMSPNVAKHQESSGITATLNGSHSNPHTVFGGANTARDSFLNYFFGKDGVQPSASATLAQGQTRQLAHDPSTSPNLRRTEVLPSVSHPEDYLAASDYNEVNTLLRDDSEPAISDRELMETELIRRLISSYFAIVRETIADQVPKAIMHLLVNHSKEVVQNRLVSELYKEEFFAELLYEDDGIKAEREKCERLLETYKAAAKIVGEVL